MKRIEVMVRGEREDEISRELLAGIYGILRGNDCTDVSVRADTIMDRKDTELHVPGFLGPQGQEKTGRREWHGGKYDTTGDQEDMGDCQKS